MGPYSGKFPTEVPFTGCFLERQTLPSPVIKEETKAASREVTHPRLQSPRGATKLTELEMTVSTTVKLRAGSWHCPFPTTVLGLHEPHGFWGTHFQDTHARIASRVLPCSRREGYSWEQDRPKSLPSWYLYFSWGDRK